MLSKAVVDGVVNSTNSNSALELSDAELCTLVIKEYKKHKDNTSKVTSELKLVVESATESDNVKNTMNRLFRIALKYSTMKIITRFDKLEYSNMKGLVNLVAYIDKEHSDNSTNVRDTIKKVYKKDMSPHRYNNEIAKVIKDIKDTYKVKVDEDGEVFKVADVISSIANNIDKFTDEDKARLLEVLGA